MTSRMKGNEQKQLVCLYKAEVKHTVFMRLPSKRRSSGAGAASNTIYSKFFHTKCINSTEAGAKPGLNYTFFCWLLTILWNPRQIPTRLWTIKTKSDSFGDIW